MGLYQALRDWPAFRSLRTVVKASPLAGVLRQPAEAFWQLTLALERHGRGQAAGRQALQPGPVVVTGMLSADTGIGQAGRLTIRALRALGHAVEAHDVTATVALGRDPPPLPGHGGVWIIHLNPREADAVLRQIAGAPWRERLTIGYWVWETEAAPQDWRVLARPYHALWAPSAFAAAAIARTTGRQVAVAPHAVPVPEWAEPFRSAAGPMTVLILADGRSSFARKNPTAAIAAYVGAVPVPSADRRLIVKLGAGDDPALLRQECGDRPDIEFRAVALPEADIAALIADCDVMLSLHRAEGFGLPLAQAMAAGRLVIATDWSASAELLAAEGASVAPGFGVNCAFQPVGPGLPFPASHRWAEPELADATAKLRRALDPAEDSLRRSMGAAARERAASLYVRFAQATAQTADFTRLAGRTTA